MPAGVFQNASRPRESLPRLCMALRAHARNRDHVIRLKPAGAALQREHRRLLRHEWGIRIVSLKLTFRCESFNADGHRVNLLPVTACDPKALNREIYWQAPCQRLSLPGSPRESTGNIEVS